MTQANTSAKHRLIDKSVLESNSRTLLLCLVPDTGYGSHRRQYRLHADVGEELLACVLQACAEDIDRIVDNQETIVVVLTDIDSDRRILLVVAL